MMLHALPIMGGGNGAGAVLRLKFITRLPDVLAKYTASNGYCSDHCEYLRHYFRRALLDI